MYTQQNTEKPSFMRQKCEQIVRAADVHTRYTTKVAEIEKHKLSENLTGSQLEAVTQQCLQSFFFLSPALVHRS